MLRLSGDQNGYAAPSVPASGCAVRESIARTQRSRLPVTSCAVKATVRPSGEITGTAGPGRLPAVNVVLSGGRIWNLVTTGATELARYHSAPAAIVVSTNSAVAACQMIDDFRCGAGAT